MPNVARSTSISLVNYRKIRTRAINPAGQPCKYVPQLFGIGVKLLKSELHLAALDKEHDWESLWLSFGQYSSRRRRRRGWLLPRALLHHRADWTSNASRGQSFPVARMIAAAAATSLRQGFLMCSVDIIFA